MRTKRDPETEAERIDRLKLEAHRRSEEAAAEDAAIDAMVKQSIGLHGP